MANIVYDYEKRLPRLTSKMTSKPLNIKGTVKEELDFWKGKKETSSGARARLKRYWDYIGRTSWSPSGTPWSAAFVSYLLRGTGFKGSSGHYLYIKYVMEGKSPGWEAFSIPKNQDKLVVQIGDVLVKERYDPGNKYATHGDVVASTSGNKAVLVGGNISNTAKVIGTVDLNSDGTIRNAGKYQILLKKNPVTTTQYGLTKVLAYGGFTVALGLTGVLGFMVAKRKGLIGSASNHLRLLPDLSQRQMIEQTVKTNWPQPIVGVEYQANYQSSLKGTFLPTQTMEITEYQAIPNPIITPRPYDLDKAFPEVQEQKKQVLFFEFDNSPDWKSNYENQFAADNKIREELSKQGIFITTSWSLSASSGYPMTLYRVEW